MPIYSGNWADVATHGEFGDVQPDATLSMSVQRQAAAVWRRRPDVTVIAPGRIELVGNHIDYNGGNVIAAAVDRWVAVVAQHRSDGQIHATAPNASHEAMAEALDIATTFDRRGAPVRPGWFDFPRAAVAATAAAGISCPGIAFYYRGTIPIGAGMASSAALLTALVTAIASLAGISLSRFAIATVAQEAEHRLGAPVGLLDQVTSVAGGLLRFSSRPNEIRRLTPCLGEAVFVVIDSGVRHSLPGSRYTSRVRECREALGILQREGCEIADLASLPIADLNRAAALLRHPLDRRLRHVVEEVERVARAEEAIEAGDLVGLGELMNASGRSSAELYDISHPAVEAIVARARRAPGIYGARMMGGGDGGTAIALVEHDAVPELTQAIGGRAPMICRIASGARIIA